MLELRQPSCTSIWDDLYLKVLCLSLNVLIFLVAKVGSCRIRKEGVRDLLLPAIAGPLPLLHAAAVVVVVVVDVDGVVGGEVLGHPDLPSSPSLCY